MRKLLPLFLLLAVAPSFGQALKSPEAAKAEFLDQRTWSELGKPTEGPRGFALFTRNMQPKSDSLFELWVKIVPVNASAFNKRYNLSKDSAYVIQYATVDCGKKTVLMEKTAAYSDGNGVADSRSSDLVKNETKTRVTRGSISDTVFQYLCLKLQ